MQSARARMGALIVARAAAAGVWDVDNVLEATTYVGAFEPHTLSIEVEDVPGVLNQVWFSVPLCTAWDAACCT